MNKKVVVLIIIICTLVVGIGVSLAYFAVNNQNDGNETNLNVTTERLGSILWEGTKVFTSYDLLPGQIGIQEFTIEKNSDNGIGIYEIDLAGVLPSEFGSDIEISLYKTTDPISNNVTVNVADPTLENETIYQEDSLNITGAPELVYQGTLANNSQIILEQADFDVTTLEKTTYYLVYHYKNNGNQDNQQGLTFSGTISVRIINEKIPLATEYITSLASTSNELVYDETTDNNLRYIGTDPNNYVDIGDRYENDIYYGFTSENNTYLVYNSEEECRNASSYNLNCTKIHNAGDIILWRIIGVMNNIDDGTGTRTTRLKIIRDELYSTVKSWDINDINNWSSSSLQEEFNTDYLDSIANLSKEMIENAVWHLGGAPSNSNLTSTFYTSERGTTVYTERPITWTGKIGLMYPSDYGYATSGGSNIDRDTCLSYNLGDWNNYSDCYNNDWLYNSSYYQWTLTPHSTASDTVFYVLHDGYVYADYVHYMIGVSPALYLSSNVKIIRGTGSSSDPYVLSL